MYVMEVIITFLPLHVPLPLSECIPLPLPECIPLLSMATVSCRQGVSKELV